VISSSVTDPVNAPKLVSLGGVALGALGILTVNWNSIVVKEAKISLILTAIFLASAINATFFSDSPLSQNLFGVYGRNNGLITYLFLNLIFVTATVLSAKASFETIVRSLLVAGLVNIAYCGWVILFGDFVGWSNPYGNILGTFGNPNFIGAFLGIFLSAYVAYALSSHVSKNWRWSLLAVIPITSLEIINSHAIQGRVVAAGGIALVAFSYLRHRVNKLILGLYSIAVVILGLFATLGALQIGPLTQFIYKTSISLRGQYWLAGWNAGQTKPFTGVGMDSLGDWYRRTRDAKAIVLPGVDTVVNAAHNVFMDMFAFGGWPLLLAYTAMVAYVSIVLVRTFLRLKKFDGIFTALAVSWIGYQIQSIISINQIGLAIWGWLLGGTLIAYERFTRDSDKTGISTENVNKGKRNPARRSSSAHESKTLLGASVFALVGILVSLPPLVSDSKWKSALNGQSVVAIEETMRTGFFNQQTVNKYVMNIKLLEDNKFPDLAHKYALQAVEWNPQSYDLWRFLYLISKTTQNERETALAKMKELDPLNPDVAATR
jgi:hypothetical protein